jgi:hypothetical protein
MLSTTFALYISVMINGQQWEAIPNVYKSMEDCEAASMMYTKDIVSDKKCFNAEWIVKK